MRKKELLKYMSQKSAKSHSSLSLALHKIRDKLTYKHESASLCWQFLKEYLESDEIVNLPRNAEISFKSFLAFIQKQEPTFSTIDFFKKPFLMPNDKFALSILTKFMKKELTQKPLVQTSFTYPMQFNLEQSVPFSASSIAILPNGNIIAGTEYYNGTGSISLLNENGYFLRRLRADPASALAVVPNGNGQFISATHLQFGFGTIVLRRANGSSIRIIAHRGASALAFTPNGNILCGIQNDYGTGCMYMIDMQGNDLGILNYSPAKAFAYLPNGNFLCSTYSGSDFGNISLYNRNGRFLESFAQFGASGMAISAEGKLILSTETTYAFGFGEIMFVQPVLVKRATVPNSIDEKAKHLFANLIVSKCAYIAKGISLYHNERTRNTGSNQRDENNEEGNNQFEISSQDKGKEEDTEQEDNFLLHLVKLPAELIEKIFVYVLNIPSLKTFKINDPYCFPYVSNAALTQMHRNNIFARRITNVFFQNDKVATNQSSRVAGENNLEPPTPH